MADIGDSIGQYACVWKPISSVNPTSKSSVRPNGNDKPTLTANAWASAALDAIARTGLQGVAVEPLARQLGVTKGSFYWHFANREALLERTLQLWEKQETDEVLNHAEQAANPHERVQRLIAEVNASKRASRIYQALSSAAGDPMIAACVRRVSERRLKFLQDSYAALGLTAHDAREWALLTYSVFLGTLQIRRDIPDEWPSADQPAFKDYIQFLMGALIPKSQESVADERSPKPAAAAAPSR